MNRRFKNRNKQDRNEAKLEHYIEHEPGLCRQMGQLLTRESNLDGLELDLLRDYWHQYA